MAVDPRRARPKRLASDTSLSPAQKEAKRIEAKFAGKVGASDLAKKERLLANVERGVAANEAELEKHYGRQAKAAGRDESRRKEAAVDRLALDALGVVVYKGRNKFHKSDENIPEPSGGYAEGPPVLTPQDLVVEPVTGLRAADFGKIRSKHERARLFQAAPALVASGRFEFISRVAPPVPSSREAAVLAIAAAHASPVKKKLKPVNKDDQIVVLARRFYDPNTSDSESADEIDSDESDEHRSNRIRKQKKLKTSQGTVAAAEIIAKTPSKTRSQIQSELAKIPLSDRGRKAKTASEVKFDQIAATELAKDIIAKKFVEKVKNIGDRTDSDTDTPKSSRKRRRSGTSARIESTSYTTPKKLGAPTAAEEEEEYEEETEDAKYDRQDKQRAWDTANSNAALALRFKKRIAEAERNRGNKLSNKARKAILGFLVLDIKRELNLIEHTTGFGALGPKDPILRYSFTAQDRAGEEQDACDFVYEGGHIDLKW